MQHVYYHVFMSCKTTTSCIRGDKMYQLVNAYEFIEHAESTGSKAMQEVAAKLNEESNPVLVVATLK